MADSYAVRNYQGQWQVLLDSPEGWQNCETEQDARLMAGSMKLANEVLSGAAVGEGVAMRLAAA